MNKKLKTGQQTQKTKTAECENAVGLKHGLGTIYFNNINFLVIEFCSEVNR